MTTQPSPAADRRSQRPLKLDSHGLVKGYRRTWSSKTRKKVYHSIMLCWRDHAGRHREKRNTLEAAKKRAEEIARDVVNGNTALGNFGPDDKASLLRALELIAPTGKSLELVCSEYAEYFNLAGRDAGGNPQDSSGQPQVSLRDLVQFYRDNQPRNIALQKVPDLVPIFLAQKKDEIGTRWYRSLEHQLERFAEAFPGYLHRTTAAELNHWLRTLVAARSAAVGHHTRHNYRAAVEQLARWAQDNGYLPRTWDEMRHVADPGTKTGEIRILTPEQLTQLLVARQAMERDRRANKVSLIPFLTLQAFAGIRHEEMNGEKALLDWSNIDLESRHIYVPKDVAKTGRDRVVPISDNLAAWLHPYLPARRVGPVVDHENTPAVLTRTKRRAGISAERNQTRNALRKSYISYRLAAVKNISQVAEEAGNSPAIIKRNYKRAIPESEAQRWFGLWPNTSDIIQLNFGFK
jgi:integrase